MKTVIRTSVRVVTHLVAMNGTSGNATSEPPPAPPPATEATPLKTGEANPAPEAPEAAERRLRVLAAILRAEDRREVDESLRQSLRDPRPESRARAALAVGRIASPGTRALLETALKDSAEEVRVEAAFALGLLGDTQTVQALVAASRDSSFLVRASVVEALGRMHTKETASTIVALLEDSSPRVQAEAALAAWKQLEDHPAIVTPLIGLMSSSDTVVRISAAYALARIGSAGIAPATSGSTPAKPSPEARRLIRDRLIASVGAPEAEIRMQVARGLHTPATPLELSTLGALAKDRDPRVRINAVRSLAYVGAAIDPILSNALKDSDPRVVYVAIETLGRVGGTSAGQLLLRGIERSRNPWILEAAMSSLALAAPDVVPQAVLQIGAEPAPIVRAAVVRALVGRKESEAPQVAQVYLKDPSPLVVAAAVQAVAPSLQRLSEGLKDVAASSDPIVRAAVAEAAGDRLATPSPGEDARADALLVLESVWERSAGDSLPDARLAVLDAAARAGREQRARGLLLRGLDDPERRVRLRAIERMRQAFGEDASAKAGPASDLPVETYVQILEWASKPRAAVVTVERPGFTPGRFTLKLDTAFAPLACWNFAQLAEKRFYDGLTVHRVVPNFVVQDGDPRGDGYGDPGYAIRDEINHLRFAAGVVGMASDGRDTAGSQWFVTLSAQPHLDGRYTAFARIVQNFSGVLAQILPGDRVLSIRIYEGTGAEPLPPL
jgi:cyclophilin family peptidyl-prolyl cis-trans isomerase/HEAT repeat protein